MSSSITLSAGVRQNLLALQSTAQLMSVTQNRLATGKRVNSALDNPSNYFTSQALNNRAGDLNALLDSIGQSQQILTTASQAIDAITKLVQSAKSIAQQARQAAAAVGTSYSLTVTGTVSTLSGTDTLDGLGFSDGDTITISDSDGNTATFTVADASTDTVDDLMAGITSSGNWSVALNSGAIEITSSSSATLTIAGAAGGLAGVGLTAGNYTPTFSVTTPNATRTSLQSDFNVTLNQIDDLAKDASYNGINLLNGDDLKVVFNEAGTSALTINGVTFDLTGLGLSNATGNDFQNNAKIDALLSDLDTALNTLRTQGSKFGSNLTLVQTRQEFTKAMINTLQTGADNLVLADTNEEGANMLALQTRQQLSTTALALSAQADQAVLRLF